jgi:hypothetical protein
MPPSEGGSRPSKFYAAQIAGLYFLMTNSRQGFQEVANALISAERFKPVSIRMSGWETVSKHEYWAYRVIGRSGVANLDVAGIKDLSPDLSAFTFFADVEGRDGFIWVLSSDKSMKTVPNILSLSDRNRLKPRGAGIWQASIPLSKDEVGVDVLFQVFYRLGFGAVF